jgi:hypothetical protein
MEYPKDPTVLPSAQRHTETYRADQGRSFTEDEVISIQIPPTNHSYLTKDAMLHFDFDMSYYEGTNENYREIVNNLSRDSAKLTINTTNNKLITTAGPYTMTIPSGSWTPEELVAKTNAANIGNYWLYYDDPTNTFSMLYGTYLYPSATYSKLTFNGLEQASISFPSTNYVPDSTGPVPGALALTDAYNTQAPVRLTVHLYYNSTTHKFYFEAPVIDERVYPFSFNEDSKNYLGALGFNAYTGDKQATKVGENYILIADATKDYTTPVRVLDSALSTARAVLNLIPASGNYTFDNVQDVYQRLTGQPITRTPGPNTAATFMQNLIYTPATSVATLESQKTFPTLYRPYPTLDTNGPYGFISSLEVYDYLGNTLIEKIPRHDLLTAIWTDLENSTESNQTIMRPPMVNSANQLTIVKAPFSYLVKGDPNLPFQQAPSSTTGSWTEETTFASLITLPTISFAINLYSFLGKLSDKFVPLHNGFTVKFFLNQKQNVIAFNTQQPGNIIRYTDYNNGPVVYATYTTTMKPSIQKYSFSNVYLRGDIVTVPAELDSRIDKVVFAKGYRVQAGIPQNRAQRINTDVKSLTSVMVVQQPDPGPNNLSSLRQSAFIRNFCPSAKLLYNKAVVSAVQGFDEAYRNFMNVFGTTWNKYVTRDNWDIDTPLNDGAWMQMRLLDKPDLAFLFNVTNQQYQDPFITDFTLPFGYMPRYLLTFDTRLPGYTPMAVCGIDTRKELLEVQLETTTSTNKSAKVWMISEFDTFIEVKPSESTAVSF